MDDGSSADGTASAATSDASSQCSSSTGYGAATSSDTGAAADCASDAGYGTMADAGSSSMGRRAFSAVRRYFASRSVAREV
ncbi:unnamed protein product [Tilletia controversa]|nr:hypothetical protein CF328_g7607 [Tilletia controversa]CAD6943406.1 unnamed protein product [Tilletia controversa]CAD6954236.1 unnamed protein product [Tilletia controversa]CAD6978497.1 unnamed protein product [Tilletia controversa]CAD6981616.1 unnamed protein product [Tilletia controversa]